MPDEPFVMISLKDDSAKKLANVLTNKSASKILTYLADHKGATESQIAKALKIPLSTVNYNMKAMVEAKLVVDDEYHYSSRGKEVNHYRLARKYIIIAPEDEKEGFLERIKKYVPIALIAAGAGVVVRLLGLLTGTSKLSQSYGANLQADAAPLARSAPVPAAMPEAIPAAAPMVAEQAVEPALYDAVAAGSSEVVEAGAEALKTVTDDAVTDGVAAAVNAVSDEAVREMFHVPPPVEAAPEPSFLQLLFGDWLGWFLLGIFVVVLAAMVVEFFSKKK